MSSTVERITRLEEGQQALQTSVRQLAELQKQQAEMQSTEHAQTRKEIMTLADKFSAVGKPNYSVVVATLSFSLTLGGAILSPLYFQIQEQKGAIKGLAENFTAHQALPNHPGADLMMAEREKARLEREKLKDQLYHERLKNAQP